ncbi:MAG: phytanoyl-CoA dioxygenase family protein [Thermomicrobiales bacterium]
MALSEEQKTFWTQNGYLAYDQPLLSPDEVRALAQRTHDIATGRLTHVPEEMIGFERGIAPDVLAGLQGEARYDAVRIIRFLHKYDDLVLGISRKAAILDVVEDLLGPNIKLYTDQFFMKPPFQGGVQNWHQDSGSWTMFAPHDHVTVWIALDNATVDNGCLHYIPGSQHCGYVEPGHVANLVAQLQDDDVLVPREPGYAAFHHRLTLHYTGPNTTPNRRRGIALHYIRSETRYIGNPGEGRPPYVLVRGHEFPGRV